jgi:hypothetical protein
MCISHGGGRRCQQDGCSRSAQRRQAFCGPCVQAHLSHQVIRHDVPAYQPEPRRDEWSRAAEPSLSEFASFQQAVASAAEPIDFSSFQQAVASACEPSDFSSFQQAVVSAAEPSEGDVASFQQAAASGRARSRARAELEPVAEPSEPAEPEAEPSEP